MHEQIFSILFIGGTIGFINWLLIRDRLSDRSAIDDFVGRRRLRIVSVKRSYTPFRFFLRGIVLSNFARRYRVTVEDADGNEADIYVAFKLVFGSGELIALEPEGSALVPPGPRP
jgi:hypothetical protein